MAAQEQEPSSPTEKQQLPTPPPEREDGQETETGNSKSKDSTKVTDEASSSSSIETPKAESDQQDKAQSKKEESTASSEEKSSDEKKDAKPSDDSKKDSDKKADESKDESKSDDKDKKKDDEKKDDEKKDDEKKALPRGMKADAKTLWAKTDAQCKCCTTWVEDNPDEGKDVEQSDNTLQHAIVVRKKKKHEGNRKPLKVDSIVVHSPLIKAVLQKVFTGYPDLVVDLDELIFDAPFAPFFFRWEEFSKAVKDEVDARTKSHLQLLYDALEAELQKPIQRHNDLVRSKAIDFELLWTLFTPGTLMYSHDEGHDRLYETGDCEYWQDLSGMKFTVRCDMIDWDGEKFGKVTLSENISKFKGTRKITTLPSYPLKFHAKADEIKKKCVERGSRFYDLAGVHCKDYKGTAIEFTKYSIQTVRSKRALEGRVMLDEELFAKFNPDEVQYVRDLEDDPEDTQKAEKEASDRLAEQSKKAIDALIKAEAEIKKKEEEDAKKKAEEDAKKKDTDKKDEENAESQEKDSKDKKVETSASESSENSSPEATKDVDDKKSDTGTQTETENLKPDTDKQSESKDKSTSADVTTDAKKEENTSSASTDSEGAPTPATEDEDEEPKEFSQTEKQELKGDQLAICTSWLRGYSLTHQKWCSFSVSHITDVTWNEEAFSELTLPADYRELILATIQSQIRQNQWKQKLEKAEKEQKPISTLFKSEEDDDDTDADPAQFDDFIASKGLGYIMLFSGNPGVGKTATAECIAELLHVPLCIISVGNLGTNAESVETALQDVLELAAKWNAVLLLDEADIFLEARTKHDIHRNAVVSVFLRLLEYYAGCLILTTNRSEEIDPAFHSRIHISLPFADLTETNREQIWRHFAKHTEKRHETNAAKRKALTQKKEITSASSAETAPSENEVSENGTKTAEPPVPVLDEHHDNLIELSNSDFRKLSQTPLNGRQIKNAFKTAVLLASYKKEKVSMKHVKTALKTIDGNGLGKREVGRMYY